MHAWRGHGFGPPESLRFEELPDPPLGDGQVRIEVHASAVNFPDALYIAGTYQIKPTPPFIPGFEVAGVVVESRAPALPVGTRVSSTLDGSGGYATHALATPTTTFAIPERLPFVDAAALTVTYQTGHFALHRRAGVKPRDWVLVHAGAGGVGSATIQLARAAGARVIATAGGPAKVELCRRLGAEVAIDYRTDDFVPAVKQATGGRGADIIVDPVGGDVFDRSTKCVAFEGRIVVVGFTSGRIPQLAANHVLIKNYSVVGLHWGLYYLRGGLDPAVVQHTQRELFRLYLEGAIRPHVSSVLPLAEAQRALRVVMDRGSTGKVVMTPQS